MTSSVIIIRGEEYKKLYTQATSDKKFFDSVKRNSKEKQTANTIEGCFVGLLGEEAAARYIRKDLDNKGMQDSNVYRNGELLREIQQTGVNGFKYNMPDITITHPDFRETYWEVKTTQKKWPGRQVMRDHAKKYKDQGAKGVVFVTIDLSCSNTAICKVEGAYLMDEIWNTWKPRKPHALSKHTTSLTHPDDAKMFRPADITPMKHPKTPPKRYYA